MCFAWTISAELLKKPKVANSLVSRLIHFNPIINLICLFFLEIRPKWFDYDQIPFDLMWKDDRHWFPYMLANQPFKGYFLFKDDQETILEQRLEPVNTLSEINQ